MTGQPAMRTTTPDRRFRDSQSGREGPTRAPYCCGPFRPGAARWLLAALVHAVAGREAVPHGVIARAGRPGR